jgi:hypothetical protein
VDDEHVAPHLPRHLLADALAKQALKGAELARSNYYEIDVMLLGKPGDRGGRFAPCRQAFGGNPALLEDRLRLLHVLFAGRDAFAPFSDGQGEAWTAVVERGDACDENPLSERLREGRRPIERTPGWLGVVVSDEDRLHESSRP